MYLWNVLQHPNKNTAVHPRRLWTSYSPPWEPEISHLSGMFSFIFLTLCNKVAFSKRLSYIPCFIFGLKVNYHVRNYFWFPQIHKKIYFSTLFNLSFIIFPFDTTQPIIRRYIINPLNPKLIWLVFKNSVRTSKRTPHFTITETNWLTPFKVIITVYTQNFIKPINTHCGQIQLLNMKSRWYI
jgi:hypothetical protein